MTSQTAVSREAMEGTRNEDSGIDEENAEGGHEEGEAPLASATATEEASFFAGKLKGLLDASDGSGVLTKRKTKRMKEVEEVNALKKKAAESLRKKAKLNILNMAQATEQDVVFEQRLRKVATQGALFNAIKKYQVAKSKARISEDNATAASKEGFLDMLKKGVDQKPEGSGITKPAAVDKSRSSKGDDKTAQWKALRDDYLLGADMKSDESDEDSESGSEGPTYESDE